MWIYLVCQLHFWKDNGTAFCISQGLIQLTSALVKLVKEDANAMLPSGFGFKWKDVILHSLWYEFDVYKMQRSVAEEKG